MGTTAFRSDDDLRDLTGFNRKAKQLAQLRSMGVPLAARLRPTRRAAMAIEGETKSPPVEHGRPHW